jgi:hypothetical protein
LLASLLPGTLSTTLLFNCLTWSAIAVKCTVSRILKKRFLLLMRKHCGKPLLESLKAMWPGAKEGIALTIIPGTLVETATGKPQMPMLHLTQAVPLATPTPPAIIAARKGTSCQTARIRKMGNLTAINRHRVISQKIQEGWQKTETHRN